MGILYFTRHGQTVWNVENKICGATDIALTELGHEQACELGRHIKELGLKVDEILYSPLVRAKDTALHIGGITGIPVRMEMRLKEQNFGKYESTPRDGKEFKAAKECFIDDYDGGETMLAFCHRVYGLLDEITNGDRVYLLVAHNGVARVVESYFHNMSNAEFAAFGIKNCALVSYEY